MSDGRRKEEGGVLKEIIMVTCEAVFEYRQVEASSVSGFCYCCRQYNLLGQNLVQLRCLELNLFTF